MKRKYLDDINRHDLWDDEGVRADRWKEQRNVYSFDERETWAMYHSFYCWLYERLKMYIDVAPIDLELHKFEYEGEVLTQKECIERMIKGCETYFEQEDDWSISEEDWEVIDEVANIWALVLPAMWW